MTVGLAAFSAGAASADDKSDGAAKGIPSPSIATSLPPALADPGGLRAALAARGLTYQLNYIGDVLANVSGGVRQGAFSLGRLELVVEGDLEKLAGWKGATAHLNAYQIHGTGLSREFVGNLMPIDSIEGLPTTRLSEAWIEQKLFNDTVAIRAGQLAVDTEFMTSTYAGLFVNNTFGWPAITSLDLPSGGPAYPFATPGVRVKLDPTPQHSLLLAVFNGDPAGPGPDDPQERNRYGLNFRLQDPPLVIGETQFKVNQEKGASGLAATLKFGAWMHFGQFDDPRMGIDGRSLADPLSSGLPLQHRRDYGIYGVLDQQLYRPPGGEADKGIGAFARLSASPSDRNAIDFYFDGGLTFNGMIAVRPDDAFGIAFGYARVSDSLRGLDRDTVFFSGQPIPIRNYGAALELNYQAQIVPGWTIQPSLQYMIHPGGNAVNPENPGSLEPMKNAVILGLRTTIKY